MTPITKVAHLAIALVFLICSIALLISFIFHTPDPPNPSPIPNRNYRSETRYPPLFQTVATPPVELPFKLPLTRPSGILNIGSTCYANSIIQLLSSSPSLMTAISQLSPSHLHFFSLFLLELRAFFSQFQSDLEVIDPTRLFRAIHRAIWWPNTVSDEQRHVFWSFHDVIHRQQSASEFLLHVLFPIFGSAGLEPTLQDIFGFRMFESFVGPDQQTVIRSGERSETRLSLQLDINNCQSVTECLHNTLNPILDDLIIDSTAVTRKSEHFATSPKTLLLDLSRTAPRIVNQVYNGAVKISSEVQVNETIELRDHVIGPVQYCLSAAVVHEGKLTESGHYYAFTLLNGTNWWRISDASIEAVDVQTMKNQSLTTATMLMYKKCQ